MRACNEKSNAEAEERQINGGDIAWSDVALHVIKSGCVVYEVFVIGVGLWLCFQCFQCFQCSLCFLLLKHLPARNMVALWNMWSILSKWHFDYFHRLKQSTQSISMKMQWIFPSFFVVISAFMLRRLLLPLFSFGFAPYLSLSRLENGIFILNICFCLSFRCAHWQNNLR